MARPRHARADDLRRATSAANQTVSARIARADHNSEQVNLIPFQKADFDLAAPTAKPAIVREPAQAEISETEWNFTFAPHDLRYARFVIEEYLGEAVAVNHIEIGGTEPGLLYIPTQADVLSLANNDVLEIAGGDVVEATYTDEFTQLQSGASRLLTRELTATYYNAVVSPIAYDFAAAAQWGRQHDSQGTHADRSRRTDHGGDRRLRPRSNATSPTSSRLKSSSTMAIRSCWKRPRTTTTPASSPRRSTPRPARKTGKLTVRKGDHVFLRYLDMQNTFPGHAVAREAVVYVNQPTDGRVRILETRTIPADPETKTPARPVYLPFDESAKNSSVAFEAPLTVEVIDPDAAKDSRSSVVVNLNTTDGATVAVKCEVSSAFRRTRHRRASRTGPFAKGGSSARSSCSSAARTAPPWCR